MNAGFCLVRHVLLFFSREGGVMEKSKHTFTEAEKAEKLALLEEARELDAQVREAHRRSNVESSICSRANGAAQARGAPALDGRA